MAIKSQAFAKIHAIQIKAKKDVNDLFNGIYRSVFKGRGLEFEGIREYFPGDEIRTIDWNTTARLQKTFVKNYREERELTVILIVDISASARFGHALNLKSEVIAEIAALLAFSAIKNHDNVGLLLFTEEVELFIKPKKGKRHVLRIIRELLYFKPKLLGTNLKKALAFIGKVQKHSSICFILSDFMTDDFEHQLKLNTQKHETLAIQVLDAYEKVFPAIGLIKLHDLETGQKKLIDTSSTLFQKQFQIKSEDNKKKLKKTLNRAGVDLISLQPGDDYLKIFKKFFRKRKR